MGDALGRVFTFSGAEVTREYYFNDHGAQLDRFSSSLLAWAKGRPVPEDGYGGAYIEEIAKDVVAKRPDVLDLPEDRGAGGLPGRGRRADVRRDQAVAPRLRGRLRRLLPREQPARVGRRRARDRAVDGDGQHLHRGRRALAAHREVRRRQGPRDRPVQRHARLHLGRPGLLPRQEGARLRPLLHHARRRPPRLRRPDERDVRRVRRRAGQGPGDPHRPDGQPAAGGQAAADVQAGRHHGHDQRPGGRDRRRRRADTPWRATPTTPTSTSTSTCGPGRTTTTPSTTCSTPTRAPAG